MKRRKPKNKLGSPLLSIAEREIERINHLLQSANVPYRLTLEAVQALFNGCQWTCQDTGRLYNVADPLCIVWIDPIADYGLTDNLRIVAASQEHYYISWDVLHKHLGAAS